MKIEIRTISAEYDVTFGTISKDFVLKTWVKNSKKCLVVTDETVFARYENMIINTFSAFEDLYIIKVKPGEQSKTFSTVNKIIDALGEKDFLKNDAIVAVGGGVISDMAGLAAGLYLRGISYYVVPTTLLSQVDASVGGKTGVDTARGKNTLGIIYQPSGVYIDTEFLKTLPEKEFSNGLAEVIKCGIISGPKLYNKIDQYVTLKQGDLLQIIYGCIELKAKLVSMDENDRGIRHLLNLGHTIGHGIEMATEYRMPHGEAVAIGLSVMFPGCDGLLKKAGLPTSKFLVDNPNIFNQAFLNISSDKKATSDGMVSAVIVKEIGDCEIKAMTIEDFRRAYGRCI